MEHFIKQRDMTYSGRVFRVEKVIVTLPNGREGAYDLVCHSGSVTIFPVDSDGVAYFVNQYRIGAERMLLELPAGTLIPGEDPEKCAEREIREETGMGTGELIPLGDMFLAPGYTTEHMYLYLARRLFPSAADGDEDEFIQVVKIPVKKAYEMAAVNEINDSKTLAIMLLARSFLEEYLD